MVAARLLENYVLSEYLMILSMRIAGFGSGARDLPLTPVGYRSHCLHLSYI
jgi:hypothetical protein